MKRWLLVMLIGIVLAAGGVALWQHGTHANLPYAGGKVLSEREATLLVNRKISIDYVGDRDEIVLGLILSILGGGFFVVGCFLFIDERR